MAVGKLLTLGLGSFGGAKYLPILGLDVNPITASDITTTRITLIGASTERFAITGTSTQRQSLSGTSTERLTLDGTEP